MGSCAGSVAERGRGTCAALGVFVSLWVGTEGSTTASSSRVKTPLLPSKFLCFRCFPFPFICCCCRRDFYFYRCFPFPFFSDGSCSQVRLRRCHREGFFVVFGFLVVSRDPFLQVDDPILMLYLNPENTSMNA